MNFITESLNINFTNDEQEVISEVADILHTLGQKLYDMGLRDDTTYGLFNIDSYYDCYGDYKWIWEMGEFFEDLSCNCVVIKEKEEK